MPAFGAAAGQDLATGAGAHTREKTMHLGAAAFLGLVGSFGSHRDAENI